MAADVSVKIVYLHFKNKGRSQRRGAGSLRTWGARIEVRRVRAPVSQRG